MAGLPANTFCTCGGVRLAEMATGFPENKAGWTLAVVEPLFPGWDCCFISPSLEIKAEWALPGSGPSAMAAVIGPWRVRLPFRSISSSQYFSSASGS